MKITLITGGARSGKSTYALELAEQKDLKRAFIATSASIDEEMEKRIVNHKAEREGRYDTFEEQFDVERVIEDLVKDYDIAVFDCLSTWLGNAYFKNDDNEDKVKERVDKFISFLENNKLNLDLILVTNEVGFGIIPDNSLARSYRDMLGYLNRRIAQFADNVYLSVCGIPQKIKG